MWNFFEQINALRAIYGNKLPSLEHVDINQIDLITGEDMTILITFEIADLPSAMPTKWTNRGVNAVILRLRFVSVEINTFSVSNKNYKDGEVSILENNGVKCIKFSKDGNLVFDFNAKFLILDSVVGYQTDAYE